MTTFRRSTVSVGGLGFILFAATAGCFGLYLFSYTEIEKEFA